MLMVSATPTQKMKQNKNKQEVRSLRTYSVTSNLKGEIKSNQAITIKDTSRENADLMNTRQIVD